VNRPEIRFQRAAFLSGTVPNVARVCIEPFDVQIARDMQAIFQSIIMENSSSARIGIDGREHRFLVCLMSERKKYFGMARSGTDTGTLVDPSARIAARSDSNKVSRRHRFRLRCTVMHDYHDKDQHSHASPSSTLCAAFRYQMAGLTGSKPALPTFFLATQITGRAIVGLHLFTVCP
jgi:hypothetical protein